MLAQMIGSMRQPRQARFSESNFRVARNQVDPIRRRDGSEEGNVGAVIP